ncbi:Sigma-E factor regulatory protein rseC [Edwardsiella tarda]|nr:Sigma-E factor regulatory protein rseC [Edwardsiella tarda]
MMREWATVISWHAGEALLQCEAHAGCTGCRARQGCGTAALAELGPQTRHQLRLAVSQPLQVGQRVEIGLQEASVLRSALLVYLTPLAGLLGGGAIGQLWLASDGVSALGGPVGGRGRFCAGASSGPPHGTGYRLSTGAVASRLAVQSVA